jgi:hypothetical protein
MLLIRDRKDPREPRPGTASAFRVSWQPGSRPGPPSRRRPSISEWRRVQPFPTNPDLSEPHSGGHARLRTSGTSTFIASATKVPADCSKSACPSNRSQSCQGTRTGRCCVGVLLSRQRSCIASWQCGHHSSRTDRMARSASGGSPSRHCSLPLVASSQPPLRRSGWRGRGALPRCPGPRRPRDGR